MDISDAFEVIREYRPEAVLHSDHICNVKNPHAEDIHQALGPSGVYLPKTAIYTRFDAMYDTRENLAARLGTVGGNLKPPIKGDRYPVC